MQTWIFQGNPDYFDIDGYLAVWPAPLSWLVRQHAGEIQVNDTVFIWRNAGKQKAVAGVIAEATVIEATQMRYEDPEAVPFWRGNAPERDHERPRTLLRLNQVAAREGVLQRERCENDPILHSLPNLKMAQATNYKIPPDQAAQLHLLWSSTAQGSQVVADTAARRLEDKDLDALITRYRSVEARLPSRPRMIPAVGYTFSRNPWVTAIARKRAGYRCEVVGPEQPTTD